jgi:ribosomal protein S18 acetylase RimI-like enzyme
MRFERAGAEAVGRLEPLTRSLHEHHRTVDPGVPGIPPRETDEWLRIRHDRYRAWFDDPSTFILLAHDDAELVGYALVTYHAADDSHTTGERVAELQSLAVAPDRRGGGIGTALLHEVYRQVRADGAGEMVIGVLATNEAAMRLYRREGFTPWVVVTMGKVPDPDLSASREGRVTEP